MKKEFYKKLVHDGYESKDVIETYSVVGLYEPEEILIQQFFPKDGNILDIGCGTGRTSIPLSQLGYSVCGIDLSPHMIKAARQQSAKYDLDIDFHEMNAKALTFADQSFDGVLFSASGFDHVPGYIEKTEVLRQVFRVLRPGAPFIYSVHGMWCQYHLRKLVFSGLKTSFGKFTGSNKSEREWGEFDDKLGYMSFMNPKRWDQAIKDTGYDLIFRQSRFQMELKLYWRRWRHAIDYHIPKSFERQSPKKYCIGCGNFMHYVVRKPNSS